MASIKYKDSVTGTVISLDEESAHLRGRNYVPVKEVSDHGSDDGDNGRDAAPESDSGSGGKHTRTDSD